MNLSPAQFGDFIPEPRVIDSYPMKARLFRGFTPDTKQATCEVLAATDRWVPKASTITSN